MKSSAESWCDRPSSSLGMLMRGQNMKGSECASAVPSRHSIYQSLTQYYKWTVFGVERGDVFTGIYWTILARNIVSHRLQTQHD